MDTNKLKELAERATPGEWVSRADGWTIRAYPDSRLAHDGIKVATTCPVFIHGQGETPDVERQVANQEFIAAANPAAVLELIAEVERLRGQVETYEEGMRSLACNLGAGGYNADTLTAAQLVDKVKWGVDNLAETQGRLMDEVRAENTELHKTAERYRELRKITPRQFKKIQEAATTDGGDVFYFHADRFDAGLDAALEGGGR